MAPTPQYLQHWDMSPRWGSSRERCAGWLLCPETRGPTTVIDLSAWPPRTVYLPDEFICSAGLLPDGRWVVCSWVLSESDGRLKIRYHKPGDPGEHERPLDLVWKGCQYSPYEVHVAGGHVLLDSRSEWDNPEGKAFELRGGELICRDDLPAARYNRRYGRPDSGVMRLDNGRDVFFWEGDGYEPTDGRFECAWPLRYQASHADWTAVPWGDGFFYLSDRRIMYAHRGKRPRRALPDADNVMFLNPGPEGSVVVWHGRNVKVLAGRLWFPAEGRYIPIKGKDLGCQPRSTPWSLLWSDKTRHFYFLYGDLWTIPQEEVLKWKRVRPKDPGPRFPLPATADEEVV